MTAAVRTAWLLFFLGALGGAGCRTDQEGIIPAPGSGGRGAGGAGGRGGSGSGGASGGSGGTTVDAPASGDRPAADAPLDLTEGSAPDLAIDIRPDLPPDRPPDLPVDLPPRSKPDGSLCQLGTECVSGICAQGRCCNKACDDPCFSCAGSDTQMADGRCEINRARVGMKCGLGCQQVLMNIPAVVDKTCDAQGRCLVPAIPQNIELCTDNDPCTTTICDQDSQRHTARCVTIGCAAGLCCCEGGGGGGDGGAAARMCAPTATCTGPGKSCAQ